MSEEPKKNNQEKLQETLDNMEGKIVDLAAELVEASPARGVEINKEIESFKDKKEIVEGLLGDIKSKLEEISSRTGDNEAGNNSQQNSGNAGRDIIQNYGSSEELLNKMLVLMEKLLKV